MNRILLVAIGGAIGAVLRYFVGGWVQQSYPDFPIGTLTVNIVGSFLLSAIMFGVEFEGVFTEEMRIFLTIGLLGSFTTMSSFNYETFRLIDQNANFNAFLNVLSNIIGGFVAVYLGRLFVLSLRN